MAEIKSYPEMVDLIWAIMQGTPEERERVDFTFSEQHIAGELGIAYQGDSDLRVYGVAQALDDLVDLGYCKDRALFIGAPSSWSPTPDCPDILTISKLPATTDSKASSFTPENATVYS